MPYKHNDPYRHKFDPLKYRITNWREYNQALRGHGNITIWFEKNQFVSGMQIAVTNKVLNESTQTPPLKLLALFD